MPSAANSRIPSIGSTRRRRTLFSGVAAWTSSDVVFDVSTGEANPQSGAATYVTGNYFQVLGLRPTLGAGLPIDANDADPAPPLVAVISHVLWERHFERSPDVIGRAMKVNGVTVTIVGVAPRRFAGARTGRIADARLAAPQHASAGAAHGFDAHQLRRRPLWPRGAPAARRARRSDGTDRRSDRRTGGATDDDWSTGLVASTDVVPLLGNNYFPPSGER